MSIERIYYILESSEEDLIPGEELAQRLKVSLPRLKQYFHVMKTKGLLTEVMTERDHRYRVTSQGRCFLAWYQRIHRLLLKQEPASCG